MKCQLLILCTFFRKHVKPILSFFFRLLWFVCTYTTQYLYRSVNHYVRFCVNRQKGKTTYIHDERICKCHEVTHACVVWTCALVRLYCAVFWFFVVHSLKAFCSCFWRFSISLTVRKPAEQRFRKCADFRNTQHSIQRHCQSVFISKALTFSWYGFWAFFQLLFLSPLLFLLCVNNCQGRTIHVNKRFRILVAGLRAKSFFVHRQTV